MTPNEYQKEALRTERAMNNRCYLARDSSRVLNGIMGMNGEAGECIDLLKKYYFQGHDLDIDHLTKEIGDVLWYVAISADAIGYTLEEIMQLNIDKLKTRYPDGFETERSINRKADDI